MSAGGRRWPMMLTSEALRPLGSGAPLLVGLCWWCCCRRRHMLADSACSACCRQPPGLPALGRQRLRRGVDATRERDVDWAVVGRDSDGGGLGAAAALAALAAPGLGLAARFGSGRLDWSRGEARRSPYARPGVARRPARVEGWGLGGSSLFGSATPSPVDRTVGRWACGRGGRRMSRGSYNTAAENRWAFRLAPHGPGWGE